MDLATITIAAFKARFGRDFQFTDATSRPGDNLPDPDYVLDQDITNAFADATPLLNQSLLGDDATITLGYLYLTAHCLCINLNNANAGQGATANMPVNSRSVGSVSESYTVPEMFTKNPIFVPYLGTAYGLKYLTLIMPNMVGNIGAVRGGTMP